MENGEYDVCVITTIHRDFDNRIYQRQLAALADVGLKVCMIAPWNFSRRDRIDFDFRCTPVPTTRFSRIRHGFRTYRIARAVRAKVFIFHDPDFLPFAALLKWRTNSTVIYDCHENIPEDILYGKDWIPIILRRPVSGVFRVMEDTIVKYLGIAIVVVPHLVRRFEALDVETVLVRNFANFEVQENFKTEHAVLYSGSMSRDYGAYILLEIAREIKRRGKKIPMRIVNRFYMQDALRDEFIGTIQSEELDVELLSPVEAADMEKIMMKGCIGLSTLLNVRNKALAYPTKIFEYFAFGLAVIATETQSTKEILQDGRLGIQVKDTDYCGWVDAIEELYIDTKKREAYIELGKSAYESIYNWDREKRILVQFVEQCIQRAG